MISLRGPKLKIFFGIMAVISLVAGVYFTFFQIRGFEETTATIIDVVADHTGEDITYWPIVEYTVDGITYTGQSDQSGPSYSVGQTTTIYYDPQNPEVFHGSGHSVYFIVVGAVILVVIVVSSIRERKDQKENEEYRKATGHTGYAPHEEGEERELYFLTDLGTPKYGHRIEDGYRRVLYEAKMTKFSLTMPYKFDFTDHEHGITTPHLVGHEEQTQWGSALLDNHNTFDFDGVDVWKHLRQNGISVDTNYTVGEATLVGMKYRILRDGVEIARAEQTSQYPHEDDESQHKVAGALPVRGFFRIWTGEQNLDLLFVTLMAFARTEAADDRGGNYGAILGTIKNKKNAKQYDR